MILSRLRPQCRLPRPGSFGARGEGAIPVFSCTGANANAISFYRRSLPLSPLLRLSPCRSALSRGRACGCQRPLSHERLSGRDAAAGRNLDDQFAPAELRTAARAAEPFGLRRAGRMDGDADGRWAAGRGGDAGDQFAACRCVAARRAEERRRRHARPSPCPRPATPRRPSCRSR